jgi:tetratricopeptide (TPR) repeat protein
MTDIFISYTSSDRDWAFWIAHELEALGHAAHVHEWEIPAGGNIMAWMEQRHDTADHILCIISKAYLAQPYSSLERQAAQWAAASERPGFALPVFVEACKAPTLFAHLKRCDLYGLSEQDARARLKAFLAPAGKPTQRAAFPGASAALSNIPITVPRPFVGQDDLLETIEAALGGAQSRVVITTPHGLRGVGKTTLAAAYAERHRGDYRATWWIRAQTPDGLRTDLIALGVRLGWIPADENEEPALATVLERLRHEGEGILLIYDNATDADWLKPYLPPSGGARVLITSNASAWHGIAKPVQIRAWPNAIGADYLIARTDRSAERADAEALSDALGGLPLAHEQAAAFCENLGISLAEYRRRFDAVSTEFLYTDSAGAEDRQEHRLQHRDRLTVSATFRLAIDEATKRHSAAEPLITYAALLAPEPIPLFIFGDTREEFDEPLASTLAGDGLDKAVAALRAFALVDRESIADERDSAITTDCMRLHPLVRQVAQTRSKADARDAARRTLIEAVASVWPDGAPHNWPRVRRLDALGLALVENDAIPHGAELQASYILNALASYRYNALASYTTARPLFERALAITEKELGPEHPHTATSLNSLALVLQAQGDLPTGRSLYQRALAISEKALGPEHPDTATYLSNLALLLQAQGDFTAARPLCERALAIREKILGPDNAETATSLNNLAGLLLDQGDIVAARPLFERALAIFEKVLRPGHPHIATTLSNLGSVLRDLGATRQAEQIFQRAIAICEKVFGVDHPDTKRCETHYGRLLLLTDRPEEALRIGEAALSIHDRVNGPNHVWTRRSAGVTADALDALARGMEAAALRKRYGIEAPEKPRRSRERSRKRSKAGSTRPPPRRKVR